MGQGRYELCEFVSKGGMGAVYRARDVELDRWVAVKCLLEVGGHYSRDMAIREAKTLASMSHPNIMRIYDILTNDDQVWIISEWLEGRSLAQLPLPLPPGYVLAIMTQVYDALAAAHSAHIVHRDIKPSNVMIGDNGRVTIIDFGVAYAPGFSSGDTIVGSLRYTDPRILEGLQPDGNSDLFSTALLQIELMTGETVLPDMAPLPLYRHIKKNLEGRLDLLLDGQYPPLTSLAQRFCNWTGSDDIPLAVESAAREASILTQGLLSRLTNRSAESYLADGLCNAVFVDTDADRLIAEEAAKAICSSVLTPKQKAAWFSFKASLDSEDDHEEQVAELPASSHAKVEVGDFSRFKWMSPHLVLLLVCGLFAVGLAIYNYYYPPLQTSVAGEQTEDQTNQEIAPSIRILDSVPVESETVAVRPQQPKKRTKPAHKSPNITEVKPTPEKATLVAPEKAKIEAAPAKTKKEIIDPKLIPVQIVANAWANVLIDGVEVGKIPQAAPFLLAPGKRRIELVNPGTERFEESIFLEGEEPRKFRFDLKPREVTVTLQLKTKGNLLIDGVSQGVVTSAELPLKFGNHDIEIQREGAPPVHTQIAVGEGTPKAISLE